MTSSERRRLGIMRRLKEHTYQVNIFNLWVASVELALARIRERVLRGGHDVPETVVRRRFERSIANFLARYRLLANRWMLFDNSSSAPTIIASQWQGSLRVVGTKAYNDLIACYGVPGSPPRPTFLPGR